MKKVLFLLFSLISFASFGQSRFPIYPLNASGPVQIRVPTLSDLPATIAPLASPTFTGVPTAPTAAPLTSTTQIATTAYVDNLSITLPITVPNGGTALTTATPYAIFTGGTTATGAFQQVSGLGTAGQSLVSNGAGALPTWQDYYWKILGTTTLTGVSTQTSNAASQHLFNGTWTAGANNDAHIKITPTITTRNTASDALYGVTINPSMAINAGAPATTTMGALFLNPTFTGTPLFNLYGVKAETAVSGTFQSSFRNTANSSSAQTSIVLGNDATAVGGILNLTSTANTVFGTAGSFNLLGIGSRDLLLGTNTIGRIRISVDGNQAITQTAQTASHSFISYTQAAHTAGIPNGLTWTGGVLSMVTAGNSVADWNVNFNRTIQFASNTTVPFYKGIVVQRPTLAFQSASGIVTKAATVSISGAPAAGTNATLTNTYALEVEAGSVIIGDLAGSGTRTVVASSTGILSATADPSFGAPTITGNITQTNVVGHYTKITRPLNQLNAGTTGSMGTAVDDTEIADGESVTIEITWTAKDVDTNTGAGGKFLSVWTKASGTLHKVYDDNYPAVSSDTGDAIALSSSDASGDIVITIGTGTIGGNLSASGIAEVLIRKP